MNKQCTCRENSPEDIVVHRYDGLPCYIREQPSIESKCCEKCKGSAGWTPTSIIPRPKHCFGCLCHQESKVYHQGGSSIEVQIGPTLKNDFPSHPHSPIGWRERFDELARKTTLYTEENWATATVEDIKSFIAQEIQMAEERGRKDMYIEICELLKKDGTNSARQRKILQNCIEEVRASRKEDVVE